jgi:hypothetical protein
MNHSLNPLSQSPSLFFAMGMLPIFTLGCSVGSPGTCTSVGKCVPATPTAAAADAGIDVYPPMADEADAGSGANGDVQDAFEWSNEVDALPCTADKSPSDQPCLVDEAFGIFVSAAGNDAAGGIKSEPTKTVTEGIARALATGKTRVYICQGIYGEQVVLDAKHDGVSLYGGFDCLQGWAWTGGKTQIVGPAFLSALRVDSTTKTPTIEDLAFVATDAAGQDANGNGNSSVAALVHGASVRLRRVSLIAGNGADGTAGADGAAQPNYPTSMPTAATGLTASTQGSAGQGATSQCASGSSQGGAGAINQSSAGGAGTATPAPPPAAAPYDGAGGRWSATANKSAGDPGAPGGAGSGGAAATGYGTLSASGWVPSAGGDGQVGNPGQGSGGGGYVLSMGVLGNLWLSIGGEAGGCGGAEGKGGGGGGASIALASVDAALTLTSCTLQTAAGGNGGAGGNGQDGQQGGPAAANGAGGNGAGGSGGAGGTAGISVAIAYHGVMPNYDSATQITVGQAGAAGKPGTKGLHGGPANQPGEDGNPGAGGLRGIAASALVF